MVSRSWFLNGIGALCGQSWFLGLGLGKSKMSLDFIMSELKVLKKCLKNDGNMSIEYKKHLERVPTEQIGKHKLNKWEHTNFKSLTKFIWYKDWVYMI